MRTLKIFISVTSILLLLAIGAGIYVWYKVQEYEKALRQSPDLQVTTDGQSTEILQDVVLE